MKFNLKYQLCGLVSLTALLAVGLLALVSWHYSNALVADLRSSGFEVIAVMKSKEVTQTLNVFLTVARGFAARMNLVNAMSTPINEANFTAGWTTTVNSFGILLTTSPDILYVTVQDTTLGVTYLNLTSTQGLDIFGETAVKSNSILQVKDTVGLVTAYNSIDGAPSIISSLIPVDFPTAQRNIILHQITANGLFLGPLKLVSALNDQPIYVGSFTVCVYNNTTSAESLQNTLGYLTLVFNLNSLLDVAGDVQGLGRTGQMLLLGPNTFLNRWDNRSGHFLVDASDKFKYLLPPVNQPELFGTTDSVGSYPVALKAWKGANSTRKLATGVDLHTTSARGISVAVGYATVAFDTTNSSFLVIAEQSHVEAVEPMRRLRKIVLATAFGAVFMILVITFPTAHFAVRPIRRLHEVTKLCGRPPEYREAPKKRKWWWPFEFPNSNAVADVPDAPSQNSSGRRENFRIPQKVPEGRYLVHDELTALVQTFNTMVDELLEQYEKLEEKVHQRTEELQQQTVLAESANEAKTMFIANVSHELRTPLNGILGMCQLVLEDRTLPIKCRENLEVVLKSGELLLHLLMDLITFSKNQVWGAQVVLESSPFKIRDFISQIMALFTTQAASKSIELTCKVIPENAMDVVFVGDLNRILQVVINLVSNALKFTNENGSVQLMIVTDTLPNLNSVEMTPYSDMIERSDYMSHPIFFTDSIGNANTTTSPAGPASPSRLNQPTRPPLFSGHSITLAVANTETDITKTLLTRSKKFLDPEAAGADSMTRPPSTTSNRSETYFVEFRVIDTGPGVAEHMQSKIFEPFIQGDFGLSRKYGGTGLGLSICQQLAKIMGGEIHLKSFEGTGSTFTLRIPLRFAAISLVSSAPHPAHALSVSMKSMESEHATVNSLGTFSGPVFSNRSGQERATSSQEATNLNLAGLSQSFFIPSRAESEVEDNDGPIASPSPPASSPLQRQEPSKNGKGTSSSILPIVAVTTPDGGTGEAAGTKAGLPLFDSPLSNTDRRNGIGSLSEEDEGRDNDQTIRVLVVEDNKINQNLVVKVLQLEHIQDITVAEDGRQAIDRVREQIDKGLKFDIIFMDIQMPNVDGHEATRQIRAMGYTFPIIALTAFAEESNIQECFETGMDCFLSKPIKRPQINQMISHYCPQKSMRSNGKGKFEGKDERKGKGG